LPGGSLSLPLESCAFLTAHFNSLLELQQGARGNDPHLLTGMEQHQGALRQLPVEVRQSLEAGRRIGFPPRRVGPCRRRLKVGQPPPPGGRPFDITRYTQAVATLGDTTKQVQTLVGTLEHDASGATRRADDVRG
jgi:hypothetical protein